MSVLPWNLASGSLASARPATPPDPARQSRGRRVSILLAAILVMSIGDLYMTLTHLTTTGMLEANPLARLIMAYNSPMLLAAWKMSSVGLAVGILFWARHRGRTEIATWFCFLVLTWLTCRWTIYNDQISTLAEIPSAYAGRPNAEWVAMTPDE
jgi:uncharacterized membrane protein YqjE